MTTQTDPIADTVRIVRQIGTGWKIAGATIAGVMAIAGIIYAAGLTAEQMDHRVATVEAAVDTIAPQVRTNGLRLERIETKTDMIYEQIRELRR